jgi:hypothetical protein
MSGLQAYFVQETRTKIIDSTEVETSSRTYPGLREPPGGEPMASDIKAN